MILRKQRSGRRADARKLRKARGRHSLQRRRMRTMVAVSVVFAAVVLATSLPVSALLSQRSQLASTAKQVGTLEEQNKALQGEARELSDPATVAGIARRDYGLVAPGSQAYEILPTSGSSDTAAQSSGHVPLDGPPVVPGSALSQQLLGAPGGTGSGMGSGTGTNSGSGASSGSTAPASSGRDSHDGSEQVSNAGSESSGFWSRVVRSLEFWH